MESVPRTVADRFIEAGGQIHFDSRLNTFSRQEDGLIGGERGQVADPCATDAQCEEH